MKKVLVFSVFLCGIVFFAVLYNFRTEVKDFLFEIKKASLPKEMTNEEIKVLASREVVQAPTTKSLQPELKAEINLDVPFSTQAPLVNWDLPYQEACEEASMLLVHRFYTGEPLIPTIADQEILKLVEWEKKTFGYYEHTTAEETARILREYFGYQDVEVRYDISIEDIKNEVVQGRPVIVPFAGRLLGNPNYKQPGPIYHMLVVKGFTKDGHIITNDVGTRRGHNYVYDPNVFWNAIHDAPEGGSAWNNPNPAEYIKTGRKAMIIVF